VFALALIERTRDLVRSFVFQHPLKYGAARCGILTLFISALHYYAQALNITSTTESPSW
jgi:hypothetical protein